MAITKLVEFAKEGSKSIAGLVLLSGFPREEKPAREWFNYLFNATFTSINSLIDELEQMRIEIDYLKKNGVLPDAPDAGTPPVVDPEAPVIPPEQNPVGTWIVTQLTSPMSGPLDAHFLDIGNVTYLVKHSSGKKVKNVVMTWQQSNQSEVGGLPGTLFTAPAKDTNDSGEVIFTFAAQYYVPYHRTAAVTVKAPNNPTFSNVFSLYTYQYTGGTSTAGGE